MAKPKANKWAFSEAQLTMFPELRYFVDGQAPMDDLEAYFQSQRGWPTAVTAIAGVLLAPLLVLVLHTKLGFGMMGTMAVIICIQLVISWMLLGIIFPAMQRRTIRAALRRRLRASGIHACPLCAYDMRSSPEQCPECGARDPSSS